MNHVPPPWQLTGNGAVLLYRFPRSFVEPWLQPELRDAYLGGVGAVICVDYHTSNVGPYRELLFIPGQFQLGGNFMSSIASIWVSTAASVESGRANWGIPKQQAEFTVGSQFQHFSAEHQGRPFFSLNVEGRGPPLPADTRWSPLPLAIVQPWHGALLRTQPVARGALQTAHLWRIAADSNYFPDVARFRPLAAFLARGFTMTFPNPKNVEL